MSRSKIIYAVLQCLSNSRSDVISLYELREALRDNGLVFLILVFSLPTMVPLPLPPGISFVMSIPLLILSMQMFCGYHYPYLPRFIEKAKVKKSTLKKIIKAAFPILVKMESMSERRIEIFNNIIGEKIYAVAVLACATSIAFPIPFSNMIPSIGILVMSLGFINRDGLFMIMGLMIGSVGIFITMMVAMIGPKLIMGVVMDSINLFF